MPRLIETRLPDGRLTYIAEEPDTCPAGHPITERRAWSPCPTCQIPGAMWRCGHDCDLILDPLHVHGEHDTDTVTVHLDGTVSVLRHPPRWP